MYTIPCTLTKLLQKILLVLLCIAIHYNIDAQKRNTSFLKKATTIPDTLHKKRLALVTTTYIAGWAGTITALNSIWYPKNDRTHFHAFNDFGEWNQIDKIGHAFSAYRLSMGYSSCLQWAGLDKKRSVYFGALSGILSQSVIEILDGYQGKYGFSWGDMAANTFGSGLYAAQYCLWKEQRIAYRYSSHKYNYPKGELRDRAQQLFGTSAFELIFKDYNASTYWWSVNLWSFRKKSNLPKWLNIAVGYGVDNIYGGYHNYWTDKNSVYHNRTDIQRARQFYLSPDIDWSKIKTKSKILNSFLTTFNVRTPLPTLEFNTATNKVKLYGYYF